MKKASEIYLIKISKSDAIYMRNNGYGEFVKKTYSKHPTYFLVEEQDTYEYNRKTRRRDIVKYGALSVYRQYRKSLIK